MLQEDAAIIGVIGETIATTAKAAVSSNVVVNFLQNASLNKLWSMINAQQVSVHAPMYHRLKFPPNAVAMNAIIIMIASFDLIPTDKFIDPYVYTDMPESIPYTPQFELVGYESTLTISNISVICWTYTVNLGIFLFIFCPIWLINHKTGRLSRAKSGFAGYFFWNGLLRLFMETFFDSFLASVLNVHTADWSSSSASVQYSNIASLVFLVITGITFIIVATMYVRNLDIMGFGDIRGKYGALLDDTSLVSLERNYFLLLHPLIFFSRRIIFTISVIFMGDNLMD